MSKLQLDFWPEHAEMAKSKNKFFFVFRYLEFDLKSKDFRCLMRNNTKTHSIYINKRENKFNSKERRKWPLQNGQLIFSILFPDFSYFIYFYSILTEFITPNISLL